MMILQALGFCFCTDVGFLSGSLKNRCNLANRIYYLFWSYSTVHVHRCHTILVMFKRLMFVGVIFSVMFKFFRHIHLVMLNRSNDLPSILGYIALIGYFRGIRAAAAVGV